MGKYIIIEKRNHLAIHGIFNTFDAAQHHLENTIPEYIKRGYFADKTLTADCFKVTMRGDKYE